MNFKTFALVLGLSLAWIGSTVAADQKRPNVVFIFADDLGYGDLGRYGATKIKTPHIDSLARDGRKFTDAHTASAVCTPSRFALLTGKYPIGANGGKGVWGPLSPHSELIIDTGTLTIGKAFQRLGYATAAIGKWHLGFGKGKNDWSVPLTPGPNDVGFDYYFGVPLVNSGNPYVYVENKTIVGYDPKDPLVYGKKPFTKVRTFPPETSQKGANKFGGAVKAHQIYDDEKTGELLTKKATTWITRNKDKPFFLYFSPTNIHHPFTPAPRFKGTSQCGLYGDFIHELDWMVGELLACLQKNGLSDNTLVIFTSDNGGMLNRGGRDAMRAGHRINGGLLGFKFGVWEGGHRVPFIARWPGRIKAGTKSDQLICMVDMLATFMALTGQDVATLKNTDSINILPALLENPGRPLRTELLVAPRQPRNLAIRKGKWMYIGARGSGGFTGSKPKQHAWGGPGAVKFAGSVNSDIRNGKIKKGAPPAQLYDLENDLSQTKNLYHDHPEVVKQMEKLLNSYLPKNKRIPTKRPKKRTAESKKTTTKREDNKMRSTCGLLLTLSLLGGVGQMHADQPATADKQRWVALFDGKTLNGWTTVKGKKVARGWVVTPQGELHRKERGGHIVSKGGWHHFELKMEWKIAPGGNSGVKYRLVPHLNTLWGLEYQLFDDLAKSKKRKPHKGSCGALYNLYPPKESRTIKPAGQWNTLRIVVNDTNIEHWLNGEKIVEADTKSKDWAKRFAKSKYRPVKNFAPNAPTRILLQDHGSQVWFRNIQIRPLS